MNIFVVLLLTFTSYTLIGSPTSETFSTPDGDYTCVEVNPDKIYDDVYIVEVRNKGLSKLKYKRRHSCRSDGVFGKVHIIRGCYHARRVHSKTHDISVECIDDGQEGFFDLNSKTMKGSFYFYMPKIGYPERTLIEVTCEKV